jgi:hypothetical protein
LHRYPRHQKRFWEPLSLDKMLATAHLILIRLTAARSEYSKALRAAAAARGKIFAHAHEITDDDLSQPQAMAGQFYATDFATEYFRYETTH